MTKVRELDFALLKDLVSADGLYFLGYAWLFGMCGLAPAMSELVN